MPFRDEREAQRARIDVLEAEVAELRAERDRALSKREEDEHDDGDELLEEATAERAAELDKARAAEEAHRKRRRTHGDHERWSVAWNLRRTLHTVLVVVAGIGAITVIAFASALARPSPILPGEKLLMQALVAVSLVCVLGGSAWLAQSLQWLRGFRAKLPFELDAASWASLVDKEHFWIGEMWWHVAVAVEGGAKGDVGEALERFCGRANHAFYAAEEPSRDERIRWARKGRKARGSANRNTALLFARFCRDDLARIGVKRVTLTVAEDMVHVSRPSSD